MRISKIHIENFRCLKTFTFSPKPGTNVLIGENNTGKSALLQALDRALGRGTPLFDLEDFFASGPNIAPQDPIRIDLEISPAPLPNFSDAFSAEFVEEIDFKGTSPFLTFRTEATYDATDGRTRIDYYSVKVDGSTRRLQGRKRFALRGYLPFYLADAFRDTIRELRSRRGFWGRLLDSIQLDPKVAASIEKTLQKLNATVTTQTSRLGDILDRFREVGRIIPTAAPPNDVTINPVSLDAASLLRNLEILLQTQDAPRGFPLDRHGEGTRSVAYLIIFRAFVDLLAREENDNTEADPILGIEEPEVHLHPHARRAIAETLASNTRQTFISTHSTAVTRQFPPQNIMLLRRDGPGCVATQMPEHDPGDPTKPFLAPRKQAILEAQLRSGAAEVFFARTALLFEGDSEARALPFFASALKIDLHRLGISLIPVGGAAYEPLLRMLDTTSLGIPWVILSDGDMWDKLASILVKVFATTQTLVAAATTASRLREDIFLPCDCFALDSGQDLERALITGGALSDYQTAIATHIGPGALAKFIQTDPTLSSQPPEEQVLRFMKSNNGKGFKPIFAGIVADQITSAGTDPKRIPPPITAALQRVRDFALRTAKKTWRP